MTIGVRTKGLIMHNRLYAEMGVLEQVFGSRASEVRLMLRLVSSARSSSRSASRSLSLITRNMVLDRLSRALIVDSTMAGSMIVCLCITVSLS